MKKLIARFDKTNAFQGLSALDYLKRNGDIDLDSSAMMEDQRLDRTQASSRSAPTPTALVCSVAAPWARSAGLLGGLLALRWPIGDWCSRPTKAAGSLEV